MKKGLIVLLAVLAVVGLFAGLIVGSYNGLVDKQATLDEQNAAIQTQLQRRMDLIPNLVSTVKGYAAHEEEVYTAIADARSALAGANSVAEQAQANSALDSALSRLLVVVENYPELKANQNFIQLQDELAGTENRISRAREEYNAAAKAYNSKIRRFPSNLIAAMFGFEKADYFEASQGAQNAPVVEFN